MCKSSFTETIKCYCEGKSGCKIFVENLVNDGGKIRCDDTSEIFRKSIEIPAFYDNEKFKRGQQFFHNNIFAMFYAKLFGLIADLSLSKSPSILEFTNQSSEPLTAYRRYTSTLFSMYCWYSYELEPGSKSWKSLTRLRAVHNMASKKCHQHNIGGITQYMMAMAQFGFMGFAVGRPEKVGIFNADAKDVEGFIHFWRVIGYILGIEDRFNICRESLEETKEICDELIEKIVNPAIQEWDPSFLKMATSLVDGLWSMIPILKTKIWFRLIYDLTSNTDQDKIPDILCLTFFEKIHYLIVKLFIFLLRFETIRNIQKYNMYVILYLTQKFPFLAYYKYGFNYRHSQFVESSELRFCH